MRRAGPSLRSSRRHTIEPTCIIGHLMSLGLKGSELLKDKAEKCNQHLLQNEFDRSGGWLQVLNNPELLRHRF